MVASANLPFGRGRRFGANWNRAVDAILGGWQLSGTSTAYSGAPMTIETSVPNLNLGGSARPNRISEGRLAADAYPGKKGVDFPWYDLGAFESVPCYVEAGDSPPAGGVTASAHGF
jgi:hypothetical protein